MLSQRGFRLQDPRRLQSLSQLLSWANHGTVGSGTASRTGPATRSTTTSTSVKRQGQQPPTLLTATLARCACRQPGTTTGAALSAPSGPRQTVQKAAAPASPSAKFHTRIMAMGLQAPPPLSPSHRITSSFVSSRRTAQIARHLSGSATQYFSSTSSSPSSPSSASFTSPKMASEVTYAVRKNGALNTPEFKLYIEQHVHQKGAKVSSKVISPFHDIPLYADKEKGILNMVVEIPRWTNAKLEISKEQELNPIVQDKDKAGNLRFVRNCFPHRGYLWNYGAFPQTWEDPAHEDQHTAAYGDNDPLDVCEIGEQVGYTGQVKQVKVLGIMALLDEGETDWKVIVIDVNDPLAPELNTAEDIESKLPGLLRATNEWFRIYKIPHGKPENQFAFTGETKNKEYCPS
ncbi:Inorganic pyrophosphatase, variant 2 [Metarhizium acridum]|uniref:Inorganic pyrophosphatase, variant 2 n=1 Tax=Metarhizium acridum TaxID=92637 RepID=UPI001C6D067F|nr:Inorganic pyrophosphatase, variant 2 [Metarhizium acridum]